MGERTSLAISIRKLADILHGEILTSPEKSGDLVESIMVGAMTLDPAPLYFGLRTNKAVVTRGDRPDIQLAALETPTRCLVLTGGVKTLPIVVQRAGELGVPIILVDKDTTATLSAIEEGLSAVCC